MSGALISECETVLDEISRLDAEYGKHLAPLSGMMLRTEAIASSKIQDEHATVEDYSELSGNRSDRSALAMVRTTGIDHLLENGINKASILESPECCWQMQVWRPCMRQVPQGAELDCRFGSFTTWALHIPPPGEVSAHAQYDYF